MLSLNKVGKPKRKIPGKDFCKKKQTRNNYKMMIPYVTRREEEIDSEAFSEKEVAQIS